MNNPPKENILNRQDFLPIARQICRSVKQPPIELPVNGRAGWMRGTDFYGADLIRIMAEGLYRYGKANHQLPRHPLECQSFGEKLFWSKFFVPMPIPTPADKLAVGDFIPVSLKSKVRAAKHHWISERAEDFPLKPELPNGKYFLKTNHGWRGMSMIDLPQSISKWEETRIEAAKWLSHRNYNYLGGEWWYSTIRPKLYIEERIDDQNSDGLTHDYKFFCVDGKVVHLSISVWNNLEILNNAHFNPEFKWLDHLVTNTPNKKILPPADAELLLEVATKLAEKFQFVRVDLYNPRPGEVILGELTLCHVGGVSFYKPIEFDLELGSKWDFSQNFI
jgi:hypothetical protein